MHKNEKQMIGAIIIGLVVLVASVTFLVKSLKPVREQINQGGLKSVINELWNGKGK